MRVLVCGGRDFKDYDFISHHLTERLIDFFVNVNHWSGLSIIHGAAPGADNMAAWWASMNGVVCASYPADWEKHGRAAGYIRNKQMLEEGKPDLVIAFPGGKGTAMMVKLAREAGVSVEEVKYEQN